MKRKTKVKCDATTYKPTPTDELTVAAYFNLEAKRQSMPRVRIIKRAAGTRMVAIEPAVGHMANDTKAGTVAHARLTNGLGVTTGAAAECLLLQIVNSTQTRNSDPETSANAALALVSGIAPRDECEAMLATQMVATHTRIMTLQNRIANSIETLTQLDINGGLLVRLQRTYALQMETLARYRNRGHQTVKVVHQHVQLSATNAQVNVATPYQGGEG